MRRETGGYLGEKENKGYVMKKSNERGKEMPVAMKVGLDWEGGWWMVDGGVEKNIEIEQVAPTLLSQTN